MRHKLTLAVVASIASLTLVAWASAPADGVAESFTYGTPAIESAGALAFGPGEVLLVGDSMGAAVYAIEVADDGDMAGTIEVDDLGQKLAAMLGTTAEDVTVRDMAIHPRSGNAFLSVTRGDGGFAIVRADGHGNLTEVSLTDVRYSKGDISNAPAEDAMYRRRAPARAYTITDLAFADGEVMVAGLSNQEFASNFRRLPYPFTDTMAATSLEIYHVSHGQYETHAPVDTFTTYAIGGSVHVVASYTCTPLVLFETSGLADGEHVMGKTVAELGAGNRPLDIITYDTGGRDYVLVANSRHPLMKIDATSFSTADGLVPPVDGNGVGYEALPQAGVQRVGERGDGIVMLQDDNGLRLTTVAKDSL